MIKIHRSSQKAQGFAQVVGLREERRREDNGGGRRGQAAEEEEVGMNEVNQKFYDHGPSSPYHE